MGVGIDAPCSQLQLCIGINALHSIFAASRAARRDGAFLEQQGIMQGWWNGFLDHTLQDSASLDYKLGCLSELPGTMFEESTSPPLLPDPDPGPRDAWTWAHQDQPSSEWVAGFFQRPLRSRGYVMWDRSPLEKWAIFDRAWSEVGPWGEVCDRYRPNQIEDLETLERRAERWIRENKMEHFQF